jgi:anti-sigma regulatory factor (Ser/Thr protein kinase)
MTSWRQSRRSSPHGTEAGVLRLDSAKAGDLAQLHPWFDKQVRDLPHAMHHGMRVALEEAVMNIAMHAFPPESPGEITVRLRTSPVCAALLVEDSGRAFDPSAVPAREPPATLHHAEPGGLGLTLLHHYCHDITYERDGERNRLMLRFPLPPA